MIPPRTIPRRIARIGVKVAELFYERGKLIRCIEKDGSENVVAIGLLCPEMCFDVF